MTQVYPMVGQVLLLSALISLLIAKRINNIRVRIAVVVVFTTFGILIPLSGLTFAQWLRSIIGDLSVLTLVILIDILMQRVFTRMIISPKSRKIFLFGVVLVGVIFYPLALGVSNFDPYRLGYEPMNITAVLCIVSIGAWFKSKKDLAVLLLLPLLIFNLHLMESYNLWDYLLDPVLLIYALFQTAIVLQPVKFKQKVKVP
jgi:hypothetical protein